MNSAAPFMGVGGACEKFALPLQNAPRGLTSFHQNAATDSFFKFGTEVLTFKNDLFYVVEDELLKTIDLQGMVAELGPEPEGDPYVVGDYYIFTESSPTDASKLDNWVSPFLMPEQKTQLPQTAAGIGSDYGAGYMFWEQRGDAPAIWSVPLTGGPGMVLVPGGEPVGMVVDGGYLYWTDFQTDQLERVPVGGGAREALGAVGFGGVMSAGFGALYWSGPTGHLYRFKLGGQEENVFLGGLGREASRPVPVEGGAYFSAGNTSCRELYYLPLAGQPQLLLSGFEGGSIVGITAQHVYVQDAKAIYRLER
jgi:hypothetical protein